MKVHRVALRDYRGVVERQVELAPQGVTIVSGPNEVGKSSLAEALELLFDERDSTTRQRVREVKPVHRDAGSQVEAEVELGPYRFRYSKRFHRKPQTHLRVLAPRAKTYTGREAHERVRGWLSEHIDVALWRALRWLQGEPFAQPILGESPSLVRALDAAAGVGGGGAREEGLFEAARAECAQYFTPTGRRRAELLAFERAAEQARSEQDGLAEELAGLERAASDEAEGRKQVAELESRSAALAAELRDLAAEREAARALGETAARLQTQCEAARARLDAAVQRARQRGQLVSAHAGAEAEVESLAEALESEEPALIAAGAELRHLEERCLAADGAKGEAASLTAAARRDAALLRAASEHAELAARRERVARERAELARVRRVLAGPPLDLARVRAIEKAQAAVERARARLATEGPRVELDAETGLELIVDGRPVSLGPGEALERRVSESLVLSIPGVGELRVVAGAGVAEHRKHLEQAEAALRELCMAAGVDDHADALRSLAAQRSAREEQGRGERRIAEALAGSSEAELDARIRELAERVARARAGRAGGTRLPESLEAAERALERAESDESRCREELEAWNRRRAAAAERFRQRHDRRSDTRSRLELAQRSRADHAERLAQARAEASDASLEAARERLSGELDRLEERARAAGEQLAASRAEVLEERAKSLQADLAAGERRLREARETLLRLRERLELGGQRGLFDALQRARRTRRRAEREWQERRRRAEAAGLLLRVLSEEREAARSHYARPLAEEIERLGRDVFGADFRVELDDELRVARRSTRGLDLGWSQLSAGAREQLGLLSRLAAARLAGGVPVWIDDGLGHTDAARLEALGPLLAAAGESTQVVVLTCAPERFRSVPAARVVELR